MSMETTKPMSLVVSVNYNKSTEMFMKDTSKNRENWKRSMVETWSKQPSPKQCLHAPIQKDF